MPLLIPAANALEFVRELGVIHRDIKPTNTRLTSAIAAMIVDFGVAQATGSAAEMTLTPAGGRIGTAAERAAEQLDHRATAHVHSYARGWVLYELITGKLPYSILFNLNPVGLLNCKHTTPPTQREAP